MDIPKFNKELKTKVSIANSFERQNNLQDAVKTWIEITEMTIRASKSPRLDASYRNMLIKKTQEIIEHIKRLKFKIAEPKRKEIIIEKIIPSNEIIEEQEPSATTIEVESLSHEITDINSSHQEHLKNKITDLNEIKIIEDSEFENMPIGIKEVEASKEFKIITPHDDEYVKKITSQDINMDIFQSQGDAKLQDNQDPKNIDVDPSQVRIEFEPPKNGNKMICFACGAELPSNTKICPTCGAKL